MDLLPAYLKRRNEDVELLRNWIVQKDFESIRRLGHKLSGNGTMYGLDWISKTGKDLEASAIDKDLPEIETQTQNLFNFLSTLEVFPKEKNEIT